MSLETAIILTFFNIFLQQLHNNTFLSFRSDPDGSVIESNVFYLKPTSKKIDKLYYFKHCIFSGTTNKKTYMME